MKFKDVDYLKEKDKTLYKYIKRLESAIECRDLDILYLKEDLASAEYSEEEYREKFLSTRKRLVETMKCAKKLDELTFENYVTLIPRYTLSTKEYILTNMTDKPLYLSVMGLT